MYSNINLLNTNKSKSGFLYQSFGVFLFSLLTLLTIPASNTFAQNPGDNVFAGTQVYTIKLNFSQPNYWDTLLYYYNLGTEQYIPATVTINGTVYDSCGVRLKGNSSFSHPNNKKSIKIAFDEFKSQKWDNLKSINLNNCYGDPTFIREKIYLDFCQSAGISAPRANFANVYLQDTLFAFYSLVESIDKKFLSSHYGTSTGDYFKAVDGFDAAASISDFKWVSAVADSYYVRYELKATGSTTAWPQLMKLIDSINYSSTVATTLPSMINTSALYRSIAADMLFSSLDSYVGSGRNFYFYFNPTTNKMDWIKWDVGLAFGGYSSGVSNFENMSLTYTVSSAQRPLMGKIFSNSTLKAEYLNAVCVLYTDYFTSALNSKIDSIATVIRPYVYTDARKQYTNSQFEVNLLSDLAIAGVGGTSRIPGLKSFLTARRTSVQTQLVNAGISCGVLPVVAGDVVINEFAASNDSIFDPAGEAEDWIELYNNTSHEIDLSGMYLTDTYTSQTKWSFPNNTTIPAHGFAIVWADEDSGQVGLHANFKLSSTNGEQIMLSTSALTVLDSISFGPQTLNKTMARIPNGTGAFVMGNPTFNRNNDTTNAINETSSNSTSSFTLMQNYPNPVSKSSSQNGVTYITYSVPQTTDVNITVYDVLGREIKVLVDSEKPEGKYTVALNTGTLSSGIYIYRIKAGNFNQSRRFVVVK